MPHLFKTALAGLVLACALAGLAEELKPVPLPAPDRQGGKPLMQCLSARHSTREFAPTPLAPQLLSDLLWAGFGINRPDNDHRTAPSAMNWQEVDLYVLLAEGAYRYDAKAHTLVPVAAGDHRALAGVQPFVKDAPLNIVYVANFSRMGDKVSVDDKKILSAADTGFIAENVYLYCASAGLNCVVRAYIEKGALATALQLAPEQHIVLAQTIGQPAQ